MFLNKSYILANELVDQMDINIANISILRNHFENEDDFTTIVKMKNCNFIKKDSTKLPANIKKGIAQYQFTEMYNKLPCSWVNEEFPISDTKWIKSGIVKEKITIKGKQFYVFSDEFITTTHKKIVYMLNKEETEKCTQLNQIEGSIQISNDKFITWYNPYKY